MNKWESEPNFFEFEYKGIHCVVKRNPEMLNLLGYAGVDQKHPLYGICFDEIETNIECHGGLTYSGPLPEGKEEYWYFGFDCAHAGDIIPGMQKIFQDNGLIMSSLRFGEYRDFEYVKEDVTNLAEQLYKNRIRFIFRSK